MAAQLVANPVQHRAAQVGVQRAVTTELELIEVPERSDDRFLNEVFRVGQIAHPVGQAAACPSGQEGPVSPQEQVERGIVTRADLLQQHERGFW